MRGMGRGLSDHHVIMYKVILVGAWTKRRAIVDRAKRTRSKKLKEHQLREGCSRSLDRKRVEWYGENNVEHM